VAQPTGMQFVGIDLHQDSVTLACLPADVEEREGDTVQLPNDPSRIKRYFQRVLKSGPVKACYEAGACGYSLYRQLRAWGVDCDVIAPSLIPKRAGDRRKTDRRDAQKLARHLRAGELTAIDVPDEPRERVRALVRARGALRQDVHRCKQRILKLLQVRGHRWGKKTYWTPDFHAWVSRLPWEPLDLLVLGTFDQQLHLLTRLMKDLEREISVQAQGPLYKDVVARLRCLHGVDTLTALSLACEIGDVRRFETPRHLMGWLGLTVSEWSSDKSRTYGAITKAGNARCRRLLVEAAWNYRYQPSQSAAVTKRREGQPSEIITHCVRAQHRLHRVFDRFMKRRVLPQKIVVAVARELAGFVWAVMRGDTQALSLKLPTAQAAAN
jgi:transposase